MARRVALHGQAERRHDEIIVYHVVKAARPDAVTIIGNKVVDGKEVTMGGFDCTWDAPHKTLSCPIPRGTFVYHAHRAD